MQQASEFVLLAPLIWHFVCITLFLLPVGSYGASVPAWRAKPTQLPTEPSPLPVSTSWPPHRLPTPYPVPWKKLTSEHIEDHAHKFRHDPGGYTVWPVEKPMWQFSTDGAVAAKPGGNAGATPGATPGDTLGGAPAPGPGGIISPEALSNATGNESSSNSQSGLSGHSGQSSQSYHGPHLGEGNGSAPSWPYAPYSVDGNHLKPLIPPKLGAKAVVVNVTVVKNIEVTVAECDTAVSCVYKEWKRAAGAAAAALRNAAIRSMAPQDAVIDAVSAVTSQASAAATDAMIRAKEAVPLSQNASYQMVYLRGSLTAAAHAQARYLRFGGPRPVAIPPDYSSVDLPKASEVAMGVR